MELHDWQLRDIISESNILPLSIAIVVTIPCKEENPLFCQIPSTDTGVSITSNSTFLFLLQHQSYFWDYFVLPRFRQQLLQHLTQNLAVYQNYFESLVLACLETHKLFLIQTEADIGGVMWKKLFLKNSQNPQENTCAGISILITLQVLGLQLYQKREFNKDVFVWILKNF